MVDKVKSVGDILDRIDDIARSEEKVCLGRMVEALGNRSYGPFLLIPALIDVTPVGSIPGLPTLLGAVIVLVSAQILFGRKHLWLPGFLSRRGLSAEKACKATHKLRGVARFLDRWFHGRYPRLTQGMFVKLAAACCIILALTVPPLELLPFATTAPMAAIAAFGLALLVRDGLLMIIALLLAAAAFALGVGLLGSAGNSK
ncbi:exopolysaccharide biosynthesis protein [Sphingomonas turrisvirgatae]|uniref:Exopolysaccharide biosynthesis protein n=1 Tax=Sphingomonas turrisvirgatae TaxID=1888892 RepID=A0A1E3LTV7_9SPHN|nr:exopolysaccharide biosynthesis protein [Sphingomonas turrisvirgatae]ODP37186.1 hypothetical protein BFL28_02855 [Sphingomonas turrisvirgatae]